MTSIKPTLSIITGSSRGMGEALALQCLQAGHQVIGVARQTSAALASAAAPGQLLQWQADLAEAAEPAERLRAHLQACQPLDLAAVQLVNNAGVIAPLMPLADIPLAETARALRVGLEAAMLLSTAFLDATRHWTVPRRLLNISSGLGRRAMAGSASYCAAKAGMDHFSRALALEEAARPHGARVVSLAPGVIDTDMQVQLRTADPARFPHQEDFLQLQAQGRLFSPAEAAAKLLAYLGREDFGQQVLADVRDPA
jgi:benzil reductase ((S)-benzoin forming)